MAWRCFFKSVDGIVLISTQGWQSAEEAALHGRALLTRPEAYQLLDPDDELVSGQLADPVAGYTVEDDDDLLSD